LSHPLNEFVPSHAFGAAIDGHEKGEIDEMLSRANVKQMLTAGLKPVSYRLRTELAGEAWHWNPIGRWSEPNKTGYFTSSAKNGPIATSYGYRLPRRGNTFDQANDNGYSRLDDGDSKSFWKSNPYLDQHFTNLPNPSQPQWILIDLRKLKPINAIRLSWDTPFAISYDVQFGNFENIDEVAQAAPDQWHTFANGHVQGGQGGEVEMRLSVEAVNTRFVRVLLNESSHASGRHSRDIRDRLGYAVRELSVGTIDNEQRFTDEISHAPSKTKQTSIYVSSSDSWHRAIDKDPRVEQPGFDRIFRSFLTNHQPMLTPVSLLYDTPESAAAELRYLKSRGYRVERMELGEEADGQFASPEDCGALYIQFAQALHAVDPMVQLGGPSFQDVAAGKDNWLQRFVNYLDAHGHLADYTFTSFEWYPFDNVCAATAPQLEEATDLLRDSLAPLRAADKRKNIPWLMTEYGYSAYGGRAQMELEGALLNADAVAHFLALGGEQTFLYGYEPNVVLDDAKCSHGNNMLFLAGKNGSIAYRMPTYYGAVLLTHEWTQPGSGVHELFRATSDDPLITAYAVLRPDKLWSVLLVNKNPTEASEVKIEFGDQRELDCSRVGAFCGEVDVYQYSRKQYELSADYKPIKDLPPEHRRQNLANTPTLSLPPYSLTILRGSTLTP
jgi:hypothetical protein